MTDAKASLTYTTDGKSIRFDAVADLYESVGFGSASAADFL